MLNVNLNNYCLDREDEESTFYLITCGSLKDFTPSAK